RDLLAGMQPRYSGADLPATLVQVNEALSAPEARAAGPEQVFVIVLSDFSRSSLALERPAPAQLSAIAGRARVYLAQPMTEQANVQIESLRPRHHMVVTRGMSTQAAVSMDVALRRFADEAADRVTNIAFSVV